MLISDKKNVSPIFVPAYVLGGDLGMSFMQISRDGQSITDVLFSTLTLNIIR